MCNVVGYGELMCVYIDRELGGEWGRCLQETREDA